MSENDARQLNEIRRRGADDASAAREKSVSAAKILRIAGAAFHDITRFYDQAQKLSAQGKAVNSSALEWLLDNYYVLLHAYRRAAVALAGRRFASARSANGKRYPFVFIFAHKCCAALGCALDKPTLRAYFEGAGAACDFTADEVCCLPDMLRLAAILCVRGECLRLKSAPEAGNSKSEGGVIRNAVISLKTLDDLDMGDYMHVLSRTERTLLQDGVYAGMRQRGKQWYRSRLKMLARKSGLSESEAAQALLREAEKDPSADVGGFLAARAVRKFPKVVYFGVYAAFALAIIIGCAVLTRSMIVGSLLIFPALELSQRLACGVAAKMAGDAYLPRLDFESGIPDDARTCVAVSLLLGEGGAEKAYDRLELLYNRNRDDNLVFGLLADLGESDCEHTKRDDAVLKETADAIERLNRKYGERFFLLARRRVYSKTQNKFIGWERKRGSIIELVKYMKGRETTHAAAVGAVSLLGKCRYTIVLDADTTLPAGGARELVSIAAHPANRPVTDAARGRVVSGYGLIAPSVRSELLSGDDTLFSKLYAGLSGVETYNNTNFELYQDIFGEGIFSGKGIFHNDVFYELLADTLPENAILSHDLLEGSILRTAYASDVRLYDSIPRDAISYYKREHRWIRGDWQLIKLLPNRALDRLDQYKMLDNLRRSLNAPVSVCNIAISLMLPPAKAAAVLSVLLAAYLFPILSSVIKQLLFGIVLRGNVRYYSGTISPPAAVFGKAAAELIFLPYAAINAVDAIARALYRMFVSHKRLLDWVTAAQAERGRPRGMFGYIRTMRGSQALSASILAAACLRSAFFGGGVCGWLTAALSLYWLCAPAAAYLLARREKSGTRRPSNDARIKVTEYAKKMWRYYADLLTEGDNYLLPDNFQETPSVGAAHRTSPTNIGFSLLAVLTARDFQFISTAEMADYLEKIYASLKRLERYRGHFYNWYDTQRAAVLAPAYVSTVDSGNLSVCICTLCGGLEDYAREDARIEKLTAAYRELESETDYGFLYDPDKKLLRIGFDAQRKIPDDNCYDLYMSEARLTSFYLTARGAVPLRHWKTLSRLAVEHRGHFGYKSWTGTMFEFFMPRLFLPVYRNTQTFEALSFALEAQEDRVRKEGIPFGISESGFYSLDASLSYQYRAFGVSRIGLKRNLNAELVISPYSSFLTLPFSPQKSLGNLRKMESLGFTGKYGFYEAIDYTPSRTGGRACVVRSFMAHHIGMSLLAAANFLMDDVVCRRFYRDPQMRAFDELLREKLPEKVLVYDFPDDSPRQVPTHHYEAPALAVDAIRRFSPHVCALSNGEYTCVLSDSGFGFSLCRGKTVTRLRRSVTENGKGIFFAIASGASRIPLTAAPVFDRMCDYKTEMESSQVVYRASTGAFTTKMRATVHGEYPAELREIKIKNNTARKRRVTLLGYFEPVLWEYENESAHPAFSGLSIEAERVENEGAVLFHRRPRKKDEAHQYLCAGFCRMPTGVSFETTRDRVFRRGEKNEDMLHVFDMEFSGVKKACIDAAFAAKFTFELEPRETKQFLFALSFDSDAARAVSAFRAIGKEGFEAARRRCHALASQMLLQCDMTQTECQLERAVLPRLTYGSPASLVDRDAPCEGAQADLWKYGVSGDDPLWIVRVREGEAVSKIVPYVKVFRLLKQKGIACELALLYEEGGQYDRPIHSAMREILCRCGAERYVGARGGIHLCNLQSQRDARLFYAVGAYIADYRFEQTALPNEDDYAVPQRKLAPAGALAEQIRYPTVCGGFTEDGFAVTDKSVFPTRPPWCHILSNHRFGTVLSDSSLGCTYALNAGQYRITPWYNDAVSDNYGEKLYAKINGEIYDIIAGAAAVFYRGRAEYACTIGGVEIKTTVFVPSEEPCKALLISVKNTSSARVSVSLCYGADLVLGQTPQADGRILRIKEAEGAMYAQNPYRPEYGKAVVYLTGDRVDFAGRNKLSFLCGRFEQAGREASGEEPFFYCGKTVSLPPGADEWSAFVLGYGPQQSIAQDRARRVDIWRVREWLRHDAPLFERSYAPLRIKTPAEAFDRFVNTFLYYQVIQSRIHARTAFYQSSGAFGFRDQLQDAMSVAAVDPSYLKRQLLRSCLHQFEEGDVMHWWHYVPGRGRDMGVRTRCSDDLLWLPLAAADYLEKTGDGSILRRELPYLKAQPLEKGETERYFRPDYGSVRETVYGHCLRAFRRGLRYGNHGLLLFGGGDWNDGYSNAGARGVGESVWLSMFAIYVIDAFLPVCRTFADGETYAYLLSQKRGLVDAVEKHGWDGEWYLRGYYDDGGVMGGALSDECKIDILPQAFSAICGVFAKERVALAMESADRLLTDRRSRLVKLFAPPFVKGTHDPGYVCGYVAGVRENGGQYTHGACFAAYARYLSGEADRGYELLDLLNPLRKYGGTDPGDYRNEPYVLSGDVYAAEEFTGRGGWSWYTGAAGWYFRIVLEELLGVKVRGDRAYIRPQPPCAWDGFSFTVTLRDTVLAVEAVRGNEYGVYVDGGKTPYVPLDGRRHSVEVVYIGGAPAGKDAAMN